MLRLWLKIPLQIRFLACGGFNTAAGFCIFATGQLLFGRYIHYLVIAAMAHVVAVLVAYTTYRIGVFRTKVPLISSLVRFAVSQSAGVLIGVPGLFVLVRYGGLRPIPAQAIMIVTVATLSYFLHSRFSFRSTAFPAVGSDQASATSSQVSDMHSRQTRVSWAQQAKYWLVGLGAGNALTRSALWISCLRYGVRPRFSGETISLVKGDDTLVIRTRDLSLVPAMVKLHAQYFETLESDTSAHGRLLDFSAPAIHRYRRTGIEIRSPHVAEDDSMPLYVSRFLPRSGMKVFDVGAHAGLTSIEFSRLVGPTGRVFAFEPDDHTRAFLLENLRRLSITNVTVLDVALGERSGPAQFSMDGTQAAGLVETLVYPSEDSIKPVQVISLQEACTQLNVVPDLIKSDIEGGELGMICGSIDFITRNPMHMSFETHRLRDGSDTGQLLEPILAQCGYTVERVFEEQGRQRFMFATPAAA